MKTHLYVDRLAEISNDTLSVTQLGEVLGKGTRYARKLLQRNRISHLKESAGVNAGEEHHGKQWRREVPKGAVLIYLLSITEGDKTDLLEAIRLRFPTLHSMCVHWVESKAQGPLPTGVLDARYAFTPARRSKQPLIKSPAPGDIYQADLFDRQAHLPAHPKLFSQA